eukprot:m.394303 g.394303  ORF g.394303 m.394303 type:complete len:125 (+) comp20096_c7_seq11:469-843(+)
MWASLMDDLDMVQCLVQECGADVNEKDEDGVTALMHTNLPIMQWLVHEGGADVDAKDDSGFTALMLAACMDDLPKIQWLLQEGGANPMLCSNQDMRATNLTKDTRIRALLAEATLAWDTGMPPK